MSLTTSVGAGRSPQTDEAAAVAARQALRGMGKTAPALAWVFVSQALPFEQAMSGALSALGNVPLIGASVCAEITPNGPANRSVVIGLLGGEGLSARADWQPIYTETSFRSTQEMLRSLQSGEQPGGLLYLALDGINGDAAALSAQLPVVEAMPAGCLGGGDLFTGRSYQVGGKASGHGGLAAALLSGPFKVSYAAAHGWQQIGPFAQVTRTRGVWVRALDGKRASEAYSRVFGAEAGEWALPPLNSLARLYPLGIAAPNDAQGEGSLLVRAPLRVETDGSLRMNAALPENTAAHFMVASVESCLAAARDAARQALSRLGDARPRLAILSVDCAWRMLFDDRSGLELAVVRDALGPDCPIFGGYGYGQILPAAVNPQRAELLNQHLSILLIGD